MSPHGRCTTQCSMPRLAHEGWGQTLHVSEESDRERRAAIAASVWAVLARCAASACNSLGMLASHEGVLQSPTVPSHSKPGMTMQPGKVHKWLALAHSPDTPRPLLPTAPTVSRRGAWYQISRIALPSSAAHPEPLEPLCCTAQPALTPASHPGAACSPVPEV